MGNSFSWFFSTTGRIINCRKHMKAVADMNDRRNPQPYTNVPGSPRPFEAAESDSGMPYNSHARTASSITSFTTSASSMQMENSLLWFSCL
jgi:hypothetical protein